MYEETGIVLRVTPRISPDGTVIMRVEPQITNANPNAVLLGNGFIATAFDTQTVQTTVQAADGEIYVSDGYGNSNVHRFAADGRLLATWGKPGHGPGEFTTPHAVAVDRFGKVLVGDRENNRIEVFDREGGFLAEWGDFYHPMQIWIDDRDLVFVTDQIPRISLLNPDGKLLGRCRGAINGAHGLGGDRDGNLYLAELPPQEITKLERLC